MMLAPPIDLRESDVEAGASLADRFMSFVSLYWRVSLVIALTIFVVVGVVLLFRRFGPRGMRGALAAFAVLAFLGLLAYGAWAKVLPVAHGSYFVLWHQLVRVTAA